MGNPSLRDRLFKNIAIMSLGVIADLFVTIMLLFVVKEDLILFSYTISHTFLLVICVFCLIIITISLIFNILQLGCS